VDHLDVAVTNDRQAANCRLQACRGARSGSDHSLALRQRQSKAEFNKPLIRNACPGLARISANRIRRAEVILPIDAGDFTFYDCAYEELLQALGAITTTARFPGPMFTDGRPDGILRRYDQYLSQIPTTRGFARA